MDPRSRRAQVVDMLVDMSSNMMGDETRIVIRLPKGTTSDVANEYRRVLFLCMELMETKIHELDILGG